MSFFHKLCQLMPSIDSGNSVKAKFFVSIQVWTAFDRQVVNFFPSTIRDIIKGKKTFGIEPRSSCSASGHSNH